MEDLFLFLCLLSFPLFFILNAINDRRKFEKTSYYLITGNSYSSLKYNSGQYGEYLIYKHLLHLEKDGGKFLFNLYIPKPSGGTTEIDVLLICSKGIFVFESKNYSGWIFGNEDHKNWTQTLPSGWEGRCHKERFYNPIMQNAAHIKHLKDLIGEDIPINSIVVFSDRCTLKDITIKSRDIRVVKSRDVLSVVNQTYSQTQDALLTQFQIHYIYTKLYPYTQSSPETKLAHHENFSRFN